MSCRSQMFTVAVGALLASSSVHAQSYRSDGDLEMNETGFGAAVAVGATEIFIAEALNISRPGVVYVYRKDATGTWVEAAQLQAPGGLQADRFGRAMAVDEERLLVGATSIDDHRGDLARRRLKNADRLRAVVGRHDRTSALLQR